MGMKIEVRCFATLGKFTPADGLLDLPEGAAVAAAMAALGVPPEEVKIIFVNGKAVPPETALADGDRLGLFPAVGGG
ncbi:thiamine S protein [Alkalidesulfovibrio alkalitolerans DSM 16529]|jgi:sulfur carrier protein ThiS|uniref:Thiamine S protein n=2 Tax=Alkalidesulfovibrio alkalitolerans TaxID=293256 RepID=S7TE86_9BACT|nr:thiamine S protein [Alkalidesulfovibrio alkalitolerans DSM 16529]